MNIQNTKFFQNIETDVFKEIKSVCRSQIVDSKQMIFERGTPAEYLYILESGQVELFVKNGDQTGLLLAEPGEVFGWSALVKQGIYTSTCTSKTEASILKIFKEHIEMIFNRYPRAALTFYQHLGSILSKPVLAQQYESK